VGSEGGCRLVDGQWFVRRRRRGRRRGGRGNGNERLGCRKRLGREQRFERRELLDRPVELVDTDDTCPMYTSLLTFVLPAM